MDTTPIPAQWNAIAGSSVPYWRGMDILEQEWERTAGFCKEEPGSDTFQEYMFWRRLSVVWSCATIEAFVNEEGVAWLGEDFYRDNLEKLRIEQKIQVLYALKYRAQLKRDAEALKNVRFLFDQRNRCVHPKTREVRDTMKPEGSLRGTLDEMEFRGLREAFWAVTKLFEAPGVGEQGDPEGPTNQ